VYLRNLYYLSKHLNSIEVRNQEKKFNHLTAHNVAPLLYYYIRQCDKFDVYIS